MSFYFEVKLKFWGPKSTLWDATLKLWLKRSSYLRISTFYLINDLVSQNFDEVSHNFNVASYSNKSVHHSFSYLFHNYVLVFHSFEFYLIVIKQYYIVSIFYLIIMLKISWFWLPPHNFTLWSDKMSKFLIIWIFYSSLRLSRSEFSLFNSLCCLAFFSSYFPFNISGLILL